MGNRPARCTRRETKPLSLSQVIYFVNYAINLER